MGDRKVSERGVVWAAVAAIVFVFLYSFPYFEGIRSANELPRIYLTMAIVERGALDIGPEMAEHYASVDTSIHDGRVYSNKAPGMSFLGVPIYLALEAYHGGRPPLMALFYWLRLFTSTVPTLLFLALLYRGLRPLIPRPELRLIPVLGYGLGTMALVYGLLLVAHQLSACLIGASFLWTFLRSRGEAGPATPVAAGICAGSAVLVDYQSALVGLPLFAYLVARAPRRWSDAIGFCLGAGVPLLALLAYHHACFDHPFHTGYHHPANPHFRELHERGFLGLTAFAWAPLARHHFSPDGGLFYYSPFLLLVVPGLFLMGRDRRYRAEALLCGAVVVIYALFLAAMSFSSGWDVGPRYVTCALPFYVVPIAYYFQAVRERLSGLTAGVGLVAASTLIYGPVAAIFPHFPETYRHPLFDVTLCLWRAGYAPYNAGRLVGLEGAATLFPYLAVLVALPIGIASQLGKRAFDRSILLLGTLSLVGAVYAVYAAAHHTWPDPVGPRAAFFLDRIWEPKEEAQDVEALRRCQTHPDP